MKDEKMSNTSSKIDIIALINKKEEQIKKPKIDTKLLLDSL